MGINLKDIPHHVLTKLIKDNPNVFRQPHSKASKPASAPTLDSSKPGVKGSAGSVVARITFVSLRRRLIDPDALAGSTKFLQDAVCKTIGYDDGDPRVEFEYLQTKTKGKTGVIVKIEL